MKLKLLACGGLVLSLFMLSACNDEDNNPVNNKGTISVYLVDAPVDFVSAVVVKVTGASLTKADGSVKTLDIGNNPVTVDLLKTASGDAALAIDTEEVDVDDYSKVALDLSASSEDNYVEADADGDGVVERYPLTVVDGEIVASADFSVPETGGETRTLEVDLRKSLTGDIEAGAFQLDPHTQLLEGLGELGSISGTVSTEGAADLFCEGADARVAVYVYEGSPSTLGDVGAEDAASEPYASGIVGGGGSYTVQYLPPGSYTLAYTCQAGSDTPEAAETIVFSDPKTASVSADADTGVSF